MFTATHPSRSSPRSPTKSAPHTSKVTKDHETIKKWTEERGGFPATVAATEKSGEIGIIRVKFPKIRDNKNLKEISWDDFFKKFEENNLAFLYQERTKEGEMSTFFKFIKRGKEKS